MMIGIDQEPSRERLAELNAALGEGNYAIAYEQTENGVRGIVKTHEKPPRLWSTRFGPNLEAVQVDAVWQEFTSRISKTVGNVEPEQQVPVAAAPTEASDHTRVEGGTGTSEAASSGGGERFESSTVDGDVPSPEPEGSHTDPDRR
jgi:hypothetical protein